MRAKEFWVYALLDPRDLACRYVGYTADLTRRFREHIGELSRQNHFDVHDWIDSLQEKKLDPIMLPIERGAARGGTSQMLKRADKLERYWIKMFREYRGDLLNKNRGKITKASYRFTSNTASYSKNKSVSLSLYKPLKPMAAQLIDEPSPQEDAQENRGVRPHIQREGVSADKLRVRDKIKRMKRQVQTTKKIG